MHTDNGHKQQQQRCHAFDHQTPQAALAHIDAHVNVDANEGLCEEPSICESIETQIEAHASPNDHDDHDTNTSIHAHADGDQLVCDESIETQIEASGSVSVDDAHECQTNTADKHESTSVDNASIDDNPNDADSYTGDDMAGGTETARQELDDVSACSRLHVYVIMIVASV